MAADESNTPVKASPPEREAVQASDVLLDSFWRFVAIALFPVLLIRSYIFECILQKLAKREAKITTQADTAPKGGDDPQIARLQEERVNAERSVDRLSRNNVWSAICITFLILFSVIAIVCAIFYNQIAKVPKEVVAILACGIGSLVYALLFTSVFLSRVNRLRDTKQRVQELDFQIDLQRSGSESERRAEKTVRLNELQLQSYYHQNLGENRARLCGTKGSIQIAKKPGRIIGHGERASAEFHVGRIKLLIDLL